MEPTQLLAGQELKVTIDDNVVLHVVGAADANKNNARNNLPPTGGKRTTRKQRKNLEGGAKKTTAKRAPNKYMEFCAKHREQVVAANPKASVTEVAKLLGKLYRERKSE